jgi:hypothetical protein
MDQRAPNPEVDQLVTLMNDYAASLRVPVSIEDRIKVLLSRREEEAASRVNRARKGLEEAEANLHRIREENELERAKMRKIIAAGGQGIGLAFIEGTLVRLFLLMFLFLSHSTFPLPKMLLPAVPWLPLMDEELI